MRSGLLTFVLAGFVVASCSATVSPTPTTTASTPSPIAAAATPKAAAAATPTASPLALYTCGTRNLPWDGSSAIDLTGTWSGDDEGVYYLRELGDKVWWLGMSGLHGLLANRGTNWTNVYRGTLSGDTVTGTYADVPGGRIQDSGPVVMKLTPTPDGGISLVRVDPVLETGFGGSTFTPCELG
jgi:hypothetical protein